MKYSILLAAIDWSWLRPENIFGAQVLERTPAALSLTFIVGFGIVLGLLALTFIDSSDGPTFSFEIGLPREVVRRLAATIANRSIRSWQIVFFLLAFTVLGFQVYWIYFAGDYNEQFQAVSYKDLRMRRTSGATLRGWLLDRSGKLENALAFYKLGRDGSLVRTYLLDREMAHLLGTERGTPGLERSLFQKNADPMPEAWDVLTKFKPPTGASTTDVTLTIERSLQAFVAKQLEGKRGAIVVLNPQNGDLLAMYSNPSFQLSDAQDLAGYLDLEADKVNKPLLNRATREFYVPGSTFKTFTLISAFRAGKQSAVFPSYADGFRPSRSSRPIVDATQRLLPDGTVTGACDGGCEEKNIQYAYQVSSNQYFAQLAIALGRERLAETATQLGILPVETPADALVPRFFSSIWNTSLPQTASALAPRQSTIVTGRSISLFDLGLEGMGQGFAGQMTPFQLALIASAPANLEGKLMKPRIELSQPPQAFSQVLTPQQASAIRQIMATVTEEPGGTGTVISAKLAGTGIRAGGKTGTAEKLAPAFDEKTGRFKTQRQRTRDESGKIIEVEQPVMYVRTDSWFIAIAPLEKPQIAIAVVVEGGGFGARTAAPVAANIILKARELGLLGEKYLPQKVASEPKRQTAGKRN
ncbi:MAG: hypothetical protein C4324_06965 [Blastocatellia bacterium]